jgi:outer membrane receptor protein involved in Fe transport
MVSNAAGGTVGETQSRADGSFDWPDMPAGAYRVTVRHPGFAVLQERVQFPAAVEAVLRLGIAPSRDQITVSSTRGSVEEVESSAHVVTVREAPDFAALPMTTLASAMQNAPGVMVQSTTHGHVSPFLRGLTGYQSLIVFDDVRVNTTIFRSGPNQYLSFVDPFQASATEVTLGPNSAAYGSDALGGTYSILSGQPEFFGDVGAAVHGGVGVFLGSADLSGTMSGDAAVSSRRAWFGVRGSARKLNDMRAGRGHDSHSVYRRFFGMQLDDIRDLTGSRLQDSGSAQYGGQAKFAHRWDRGVTSALFQRTELDYVRSYRDLNGGLGRLQSLFRPQHGQLGYIRYEQQRAGWLDTLAGRFSFNSQHDGQIRQGLNFGDTITREGSRANAYGYAVQATSHITNRHAQLFGMEFYDERVRSAGFQRNPQTGAERVVRAPLPNGTRYGSLGVFGQTVSELIPRKLRGVVGVRWTRVGFETFQDQNVDSQGNPLGVSNATGAFYDTTFNASLSWQVARPFSVHAVVGRGFRAPNVTDFGGIGLSSLGYEIPAVDVGDAGALIGTNAGEAALSTGRQVTPLSPETLLNYELGATLQTRRIYVRSQAFLANLNDPIVRRTALFAANAIPSEIAGLRVTPLVPTAGQAAQGVVGVRSEFDPRAIKTIVNDGAARYSGIDTVGRAELTDRWTLDAAYSFIAGRVLNPNRNMRRLPPQHGRLSLRYFPGGGRPWVALSGNFSGPQRRLEAGDLDDERIGASRSRNDIAAFFNGGRIAGFRDGGVFTPTGETLWQIQDRVLPLDATINGVTISNNSIRVPMLLATAGWVTLDLQAGMRLSESAELHFGVMNLLDRNGRVHGSGVDLIGVNAFAGVRWRF